MPRPVPLCAPFSDGVAGSFRIAGHPWLQGGEWLPRFAVAALVSRGKMMEKYLRVMDGVYRICIWLSGTSIIVMSLVIPWGVFARKVLNSGSSWPEPVAIFSMVIFTFFGAAATYRANGHIAVDMLVQRLSAGKQRVLIHVVDTLMISVTLFMIVYGTLLCRTTWNQSVDSLPSLNVGLTYLPLPLGSLAILLFIIERMVAGTQSDRPIVTYDHAQELPAAKEGGL